MSHYDERMEWTTEPRELGWFARLVAPEGGGRPATAALAIGIAGAAAFVASLALDWQSVTLPAGERTFDSTTSAQSFGDNIANVFMLGLVYAVGGVVLLGLLGTVVTRSELALRLRMPAAGVTVGLVGVLVAATIRMPEYLMAQAGFGGPGSPAVAGVTTSYEPGIFCAYAAVVLPMVAIWLAARPAARALHAAAAANASATPNTGYGTGDGTTVRATRAEARHAADHADPADGPEFHRPPVHGDGYRGLSVSTSEPLDLSVRPDAFPR